MTTRFILVNLCTLVVILSGCLGVGASLDQTSQNGTGNLSAQTVNTTELEQAIHAEVNEERTKRGLSSLDWDDELRTVAAYHSEDMATEDYIAHTAPDGETLKDRYERFNIGCVAGGENIAMTYADRLVQMPTETVDYNSNETRIAEGVVTQWLSSQAHKQNLLRDWQTEGIGVETTHTENGTKVYVTQTFC